MNLYGFEKQAYSADELLVKKIMEAQTGLDYETGTPLAPVKTKGFLSGPADSYKKAEMLSEVNDKLLFSNYSLSKSIEEIKKDNYNYENGLVKNGIDKIMNNKKLSIAIGAVGLGAIGYGIYSLVSNQDDKKEKKASIDISKEAAPSLSHGLALIDKYKPSFDVNFGSSAKTLNEVSKDIDKVYAVDFDTTIEDMGLLDPSSYKLEPSTVRFKEVLSHVKDEVGKRKDMLDRIKFLVHDRNQRDGFTVAADRFVRNNKKTSTIIGAAGLALAGYGVYSALNKKEDNKKKGKKKKR